MTKAKESALRVFRFELQYRHVQVQSKYRFYVVKQKKINALPYRVCVTFKTFAWARPNGPHPGYLLAVIPAERDETLSKPKQCLSSGIC